MQKMLMLSLTLMGFLITQGYASSTKCCPCPCDYVITSDDFKKGKTYVINKPGVYCLAENVIYSPKGTQVANAHAVPQLTAEEIEAVKACKSDFQRLDQFERDWEAKLSAVSVSASSQPAAILIKADNVILDLRGHLLKQGNNVANVVGIELTPGIHNVTIRNGSIKNFTQAAIHSFIDDSAPQVASSILNFENLILYKNGTDGVITNNQASGISLESPAATFEPNLRTDYKYYNVTINNCEVDKNIAIGILVNQGQNIRVVNTQANNQYFTNANFNRVCGLRLINSFDVQLFNSTFNNSLVKSGFGNVAAGLNMHSTVNLEVNNCQFNGSSSLEGNVFVGGIIGASNQHWLFQNSQFNNHFGASGSNVVEAIHSSDNGTGVTSFDGGPFKFVNCQFTDIRNDGGFVCGPDFLTLKDVFFENCQFANISNGEHDFAFGLQIGTLFSDPLNAEIASTRNISIRGCEFGNIHGIDGAHGIQFYSAPDTDAGKSGADLSNITIDNNTFNNIGSSAGDASGVLMEDDSVLPNFPMELKNVVFKNNVFADIHGNTKAGAAIKLVSVIAPVVSNNIVDNADNGIYFTGTAAKPSVSGVVKDNVVNLCSGAGYRDDKSPTDSTWINNTAVRNGTNYQITWTGTPPIDTGLVVAPYPAPGNKYYNLSLN